MTWLAAAAYGIPQELGDFGVLVHAGWSKGRALLFNVIPASTFLLGGVIAYLASFKMDVGFLLPFAAGDFIYIGASDLVPEVNKQRDLKRSAVHFSCFVGGRHPLPAGQHARRVMRCGRLVVGRRHVGPQPQ